MPVTTTSRAAQTRFQPIAFQAIRPVGGLLPIDALRKIAAGDASASRPADYHLVGVRSVADAAERHWDYLKGAWRALREQLGEAGSAPGPDPSGLAASNWLLPLLEEHGFGRVQPLPAGITGDDGTTLPVSHAWNSVPVHLVPWDTDLDRRPASGGLPPQSLLQQALNRSAAHLWGIVSNGRQLRILRDSAALSGVSYVEIDLEAMFDGELTGEYVTLYRLLHASRFETAPGAPPSSARIEKWRAEAIDEGARILDQQRDGVEAALVALGTGFRRHPANAAFREDADPELVKRALLRVVYRLLFWFVAEERDALHDPECDQKARARYDRYFSARRLRDLALRRHGGTHGDLWQAVTYVLDGLGNERGLPELGLPGLGGIYDDTDTDLILHAPREADGTGSKGPHLQIANEYLLAAVRSLSRFHDKGTGRYRRVDFLHLGSEELGSIYESLLELVPRWGDDRQFLFRDPALARGDDPDDGDGETGDEDGTAPGAEGKKNAGGNERKKTGSYYTPASLIDCLLDSALDPVLDAAVKRGEHTASKAQHCRQGRPRPRRGGRRRAAEGHRLRPGLWLRALPGRGLLLDRQAPSRRPGAQPRADRDRLPARAPRRGRDLPVRGGPQPDGGRASEGLPLDGGPGAREGRCPSSTPTSSRATASSARPRPSSGAASPRARSRRSRATTRS